MAIEETDIWLGKSRSGKALNLAIDDVRYTIAISTLERLLKNEIKGLRLGKFVPSEDEPERIPKSEKSGV